MAGASVLPRLPLRSLKSTSRRELDGILLLAGYTTTLVHGERHDRRWHSLRDRRDDRGEPDLSPGRTDPEQPSRWVQVRLSVVGVRRLSWAAAVRRLSAIRIDPRDDRSGGDGADAARPPR